MHTQSAAAPHALGTPTHASTPPLSLQPAMYPDQMPDIYEMVVDGECMQPFFHHGQQVLLSKASEWEVGDPVLIFLKPESLAPGQSQVTFKQLLTSPGPGFWQTGRDTFKASNIKPLIMARQLNPIAVYTFRAEDILGIHKCLGPINQWVPS